MARRVQVWLPLSLMTGMGEEMGGRIEEHIIYWLGNTINYILLRTAAILYLLSHTLTQLDRLSDCESF